MAKKEESRYCPRCQRWVLAGQEQPNHVLHAILCIFTCLLWSIIWGLLALMTENDPWLCPTCGAKTLAEEPGRPAPRS